MITGNSNFDVYRQYLKDACGPYYDLIMLWTILVVLASGYWVHDGPVFYPSTAWFLFLNISLIFLSFYIPFVTLSKLIWRYSVSPEDSFTFKGKLCMGVCFFILNWVFLTQTVGYVIHRQISTEEERVFEVEETMSNGCQSLRMRRCDHGFRMVALNKHFGANFIRPGIMEYYENFKDKGVQRILIKARISPLGYSFPREAQMPPTLQKPGDYMIIKDK